MNNWGFLVNMFPATNCNQHSRETTDKWTKYGIKQKKPNKQTNKQKTQTLS